MKGELLGNMKNYIEFLIFFRNDAKTNRIKNGFLIFRYRGATDPGF